MGAKKKNQHRSLHSIKACGQGLYPTLQLLIRSKEAFPIMGNKDLIAEDYFFFFPFFLPGLSSTFVRSLKFKSEILPAKVLANKKRPNLKSSE
jgi:hypothetical protein